MKKIYPNKLSFPIFYCQNLIDFVLLFSLGKFVSANSPCETGLMTALRAENCFTILYTHRL